MMANTSWGLRREWGKRHCPRCSSPCEAGEGLCWFCKWDMTKVGVLCERCGAVIEQRSKCDHCNSGPKEDDDE